MTPISRITGALAVVVALCSCASTTDHFYTLRILPEQATAAAAAPALHIVLSVTLPELVDRAEMIINTAGTGIEVLDHQRWAVTLSDQVAQTLARDLEKRRADILVGDRSFDQAASPAILVTVDIVHISSHLGRRVQLEAHWRVVDSAKGMDQIGSDSFEAPLGANDSDVPEAYSQVLSQLAGEIVNSIHSG